MLTSMPGTAAASSYASENFAKVLADYTVAPRPAQAQAQAWNDDGLENDTVTLSSETPPVQAPQPKRKTVAPRAVVRTVAPRAKARKPKTAAPRRLPVSVCISEWAPAPSEERPAERKKSASVCVRMSTEERALLNQRAASAGMSTSAYMRSCVFEAENLRAQVKAVLAQFRLASSANERPLAEKPLTAKAVSEPKHRLWHLPWWLGGAKRKAA